jgi:SAM-dependent methyltransferase
MALSSTHKDIAYHDTTAGEYDSVVVEPRKISIDALFRPLQWQLPSSRRAMLDIGCGTGHMLSRYGKLFEQVVAVDHSQQMIQIARKNAQKAGVTKIEFDVADAFIFLQQRSSESFDFITCVGFLHHLGPSRIEEIFLLIKKMLSPNGRFVFSEPVETNFQEPRLITWWNSQYRKEPKLYSMHAEDPEEAPLQIDFLRKAAASSGFDIVKESRGWEIFPRSKKGNLLDTIAISILHRLFGKNGFVYWACCKNKS